MEETAGEADQSRLTHEEILGVELVPGTGHAAREDPDIFEPDQEAIGPTSDNRTHNTGMSQPPRYTNTQHDQLSRHFLQQPSSLPVNSKITQNK